MNETTTTSMPPGGAAPSPHRLVRTPDGKIAGVAAGIGHYLGIDPTIVRIAFIVLAFAGGIGILLYLASWLVMPKGEIADAGGRADDRRGVDLLTVGALAALVVGVGLLFGWNGLDHGFQVAAGIALIGVGIWLLVRDRPPEGPGTPAEAPPSPGGPETPVTPPPAEGAPEGATAIVEGAAPAAPEARRGLVTAGVLSLLSIGTALVVAGTLSGWFDASATVVLAAALVVVGAGLVLASVVGRAPWLFVVGMLLTLSLLTAAAVEPLVEDGVGEKIVAPADVSELQSRYAYGIGDYTVDLRDVVLGGETRRVEVELGIGELTVLVPDGVPLTVDAHVQGGQILLPEGQSTDGWDETLRYESGTGPGRLVLDVEVGFGEAEVRRG